MIKNATFTSVWDGGYYEITTNCKVDMETKAVFEIEKVEVEGLDILEREYITIDGIDYEMDDSEFWYE